MATATSSSAPQYVQQAFNWDELDTAQVVAKTATHTTVPTAIVEKSRKQPLTVPTYSTSSSARRGRCEHVGGILASVLEKYGIGIDQLIAEIDGLK